MRDAAVSLRLLSPYVIGGHWRCRREWEARRDIVFSIHHEQIGALVGRKGASVQFDRHGVRRPCGGNLDFDVRSLVKARGITDHDSCPCCVQIDAARPVPILRIHRIICFDPMDHEVALQYRGGCSVPQFQVPGAAP